MELKDFICNTLTQIANGVQEAIDASKGKDYLISPSTSKVGKGCSVHFDLSIESKADGVANIKVLSGGASKASLNRITFDVDMTLPKPD